MQESRIGERCVEYDVVVRSYKSSASRETGQRGKHVCDTSDIKLENESRDDKDSKEMLSEERERERERERKEKCRTQ